MDNTTDTGPAGEPGSIIPGNSGPAAPAQRRPMKTGPLSDRVGRDPSNLGDDVTDQGDVVYPDAGAAGQQHVVQLISRPPALAGRGGSGTPGLAPVFRRSAHRQGVVPLVGTL